MRIVYLFLMVLVAAIPSTANAKKPTQFVSLDSEKRVWVVDVMGKDACPVAASLLAKERNRQLEHVFPTFDGDFSYTEGCIAVLK